MTYATTTTSPLEGYDIVSLRNADDTVIVRAYVPTGSSVRWACEQMALHSRVLEAAAKQRKAAAAE